MKQRAPLPGSGTAAARRARRMAAWAATCSGTALLALLAAASPAQAQSQTWSDPTNLFGTRGLLGTPSARMAPDGQLSVGASFLENNQHYNLGFQALPWLETNFRYSGLQHFDPLFKVYYDRAFGVKLRLWDEGEILPAVALGLDDIIGTGVYSSEYLVASKRFGALDTSLGIGWGRRAGTAHLRNPIAKVFPSFENRSLSLSQAGVGGFKAFFHGHNVGLFGGVAWHTPLDGLSLLVEYDSDNYSQEKARGNFSPRNQVNVGVNYDLSDSIKLGLGYLYGKTMSGSFSLQLDPVHPQYPQKIETPPPEMAVRSDADQMRALNALIERRDPRTVRQSRLFERRNADRNDFVDALWRQGADYADIQVRNGQLDLTVTGEISGTRCAAIARLTQGVATHFTRIALHDPQRRHSLSCLVPASLEAAPISAAFLSDSGVAGLTVPLIQVQTIDATDVTPASDPRQVELVLRKALAEQNLLVEALALGDSELVVYYRNYHYQNESDALDRIVRVLSRDAPPQIEKFRVIAINFGVPNREFDVLRGPAERSFQQENGEIFNHSVSMRAPALDQPVLAEAAQDFYPRFSWGIYPQFRQSLFDPNQPFGVQLVAAVGAGLELAPGLTLLGSADFSLYDDFDTSRVSDSVLPHVRSDFMKYFTQGKTGINNLEADYRFRAAPTVFVKWRAGYLESMFAGAGGEILWRPEGARWAIGADAYEVWQRSFDRLFGLQRYRRTTGHISLYYDSPWYDLNFQLRAGQYLAGDRGVTLQITRRFATGVEIGAFVTKTNVSAAQFGEGSFDKGIIIRIPLAWATPLESQSQIALDLRPVQRDGGQLLAGDATLYDETRMTSQGELRRLGLE